MCSLLYAARIENILYGLSTRMGFFVVENTGIASLGCSSLFANAFRRNSLEFQLIHFWREASAKF